MISYLTGILKHKSTASVILLAGQVGYKIFVPVSIISQTRLDEQLEVFTHTYVKEDALDLYGFSTFEELQLFELLLSVSGIGPKTALGIFSCGTQKAIKEAISRGNVDFFTSVPRLGKKNAQKIIIELRSKLGSLEDINLFGEDNGEHKEILDALKAFGFSIPEVKEAVQSVRDLEADTATKIREALKYLGKRK